MNDIVEKYQEYCRPSLSAQLGVIRLNLAYHSAKGDMLYYSNGNGEKSAIDFLGGFGASVFGHNHPELLKVGIHNFTNDVPFNTQASCRGGGALLAEKLNEMVNERTGKSFIVMFASTGSEIVEAAIKHAENSQVNKIAQLLDNLSKDMIRIKREVSAGKLQVDRASFNDVALKMGLSTDAGLESILDEVQNFNKNSLSTPPTFLCLVNSFHGKTTGSLKLTHGARYTGPFYRIGIRTVFVDSSDRASLDKAVEEASIRYFLAQKSDGFVRLVQEPYVNVSALFIEPLQGEGGIHIISKAFVEYSRETCTRYGFPMVFDEIQSGMGRTGTFLYSEQLGVVADYYLLSKSLGGGLSKISALLIDKEQFVEGFDIIHTSTFGEDDHSTSIARAALELLDKDDSLMKNCTARGQQLIEGLKKVQREFPGIIADVRGAGLMIGLQFTPQNNAKSIVLSGISQQNQLVFIVAGYLLHEHGIRVFPTMSDNATMRLEPSAYISAEACDKFLVAIHRVCEIIYKHDMYQLMKYIVGAETPGVYGEVKNYRAFAEPPPKQNGMRKVAFIGHFISSADFRHCDESLKENFTDEQFEIYFEKLYPNFKALVSERIVVKSATGQAVELDFLGLMLNSNIIARHWIYQDLKLIRSMVDDAVNQAIDLGCDVIGFGGFSSIVTKNCTDIVTDKIACTTGNSFTVAMGLEALTSEALRSHIDIATGCLAAIGATGNICSVYCEIMAERVPRLILIGRAGGESRLRDVAADIYRDAFRNIKAHAGNGVDKLQGVAKTMCASDLVRPLLDEGLPDKSVGYRLFDLFKEKMGDGAPVSIATEIHRIKEANLIVSASNSADPVIFPSMLGPGPIVICDIAVPLDTDNSVLDERKDVSVIMGGVVKLPNNPDFVVRGLPLPKGEAFACMSETTLLGLSGAKDHFSYGRISKDQVKQIAEIGKKHGYALARSKVERSY